MDTLILIIFGFIIAVSTGIVHANNYVLRRKYKHLKRAYSNQDSYIKLQESNISDLENELIKSCLKVSKLTQPRGKDGRFIKKSDKMNVCKMVDDIFLVTEKDLIKEHSKN